MILSGLKYIAGRLSRSIAVVATAVALTLVSCGQDTPDTPTGEDQAGVVAFRVLAFKTAATPASRAEGPLWGNDYPAQGGDFFETNILKDQLYAMITSADCAAEYAVTNLVCTRVEENGLFVKYEYQGRIDKDDVEKVKDLTDGKLHIIANAGYKPALSSETIFTRYGQKDDFDAIPMWGVTTCDFSKIEPGTSFNTGEIALLRSMAKVVIENDKGEDNKIEKLISATVSTVNTKGCLLPTDWDKIGFTKGLNRHALNIPSENEINKDVVYAFNDNNQVEFYLPEINNQSGELKLTLTFETEGVERTGSIYFRKYNSSGELDEESMPYDIRRNYLYRFNVRGDFHEILFKLNVEQWVEGGRTEIEM